MAKLKYNIKTTCIDAWKNKSFGFAFWGVFIFGSILVGFLGKVYFSILRNVDLFQNAISIPGHLNLWGYVSLLYMMFSIYYLYKKINLLSINYQKYMYLFLGFYICSLIITFALLGTFSIFYLVGEIIYNLIAGVAMNYYFSELVDFYINALECAAKKSFQ